MIKLTNEGRTLHIKVTEKNIKHTYIKQKDGYLEISKSQRMRMDSILNKIEENFDFYYEKTLKKDDRTLSLWGVDYKLNWVYSELSNYQIEKNQILVYSKACDYNLFKDIVLKNELLKYIPTLQTEIEPVLIKNNLSKVLVRVKKLKSKYGSYHTIKNEITLNSFLATLDKKYTKHVLLHEYAHQKVANHQKGFYSLLDKLYPEHKETQKKLKKIGLNY